MNKDCVCDDKGYCVSCVEEKMELVRIRDQKQDIITITREEYEGLLESEKVLLALQGAGVDNWEGYDMAMEQQTTSPPR